MGGTMTRSACGKMTRRSKRRRGKPMASAASHCPRLTDCMPERTTSATNAEVEMIKPVSKATNSGEKLMPLEKLKPFMTAISKETEPPLINNNRSETSRERGGKRG